MRARLVTLIVVCIVVGTFAAGIITRAQRDDLDSVDLVVLNGRVYTGPGEPVAEAVAVRAGLIVAVGSNREMKRLTRKQTTVLDAHGASVLPGFTDSHADFLAGARLSPAPDGRRPQGPEPDEDTMADMLLAGMREAHARGVTSIQTRGDLDALAAWESLRAGRELALRVFQSMVMPDVLNADTLTALTAARDQHGNDPLLKARALELDATEPDLDARVSGLEAAGWQVRLRAVGPDERERAVAAFEAAARSGQRQDRDARHLLLHDGAGDAALEARLKEAGAGLQSGLAAEVATLLASTSPEARATAVDSLTLDAARAAFDEQRRGRVARGQLADLVVLSGDLFAPQTETVTSLDVAVTIFDGRVVFVRDAE